MSEDIYKEIAEQSPHPNFVYDLDSQQFIYVNRAFKLLTGAVNKALSVDNIFELIHTEDREYVLKSYQTLLDGVNQPSIDFRIQLNQEEKWIRVTPFIVSLASGRFMIVYAADITADTNNLHTMKKYANKKNSILNILSHDLRGPLGIANTVTQVLSRKLDEPKLVDMLKTVSKILNQSISLIADLTGREFLETTGVELVKQRINIAVKLRDYMEEAQKSAGMTKRTFTFSCSDENIFIDLDESKFMQIMNNLITNALKFTKDDGVISLNITDQPDSVLFSFSDNGIGIPEEFHSTLFEKR